MPAHKTESGMQAAAAPRSAAGLFCGPARLLKVAGAALVVMAAGAAVVPEVAVSRDLGIEGQVFEPIEEDFRLAMLRMVARHDWTREIQNLEQSARDYTKNLPQFYLPLAERTQTRWKDVGLVTSEDIYFPTIDWETGSVFEPQQMLAVPAGTYLNPVAQLPSAAIDRVFVFDATAPDQLEFAKQLMRLNIPLLSFMIVAGDLTPISNEMQRPVFHATEDMLRTFQVRAVPTLIGFGRGPHLGHLATTEFKLPMTPQDIHLAWFGLPYPGYDPNQFVEPSITDERAAQVRAAFSFAAQKHREQFSPVPSTGLPGGGF